METKNPTIKPQPLCELCRSKLIHKSKFKRNDPWMALEVTSLLVLVQKSMIDKKFLIKYGNDVEGINKIECLGCFLPDMLNKIIEAAKTKDLLKVKALGEFNE